MQENRQYCGFRLSELYPEEKPQTRFVRFNPFEWIWHQHHGTTGGEFCNVFKQPSTFSERQPAAGPQAAPAAAEFLSHVTNPAPPVWGCFNTHKHRPTSNGSDKPEPAVRIVTAASTRETPPKGKQHNQNHTRAAIRVSVQAQVPQQIHQPPLIRSSTGQWQKLRQQEVAEQGYRTLPINLIQADRGLW